MKKIVLAIAFGLIISSVYAQEYQATVEMEPGYTNQVFYQLSTGDTTSMSISSWDLGFQTTLMNASVIINDNTVSVYKAPGVDSTDYATLDVSNYATWPQLHNSDTSWSMGALNDGEDISTFNFGWGIYDFNSHEVFGNTLFVIVKGSDVYKFWIRKKTATGDYLVRYANTTSGAGDVDATLTAATASDKNLVYLKLENPVMLNPEPVSADWDLLFTHYQTDLPYVGWYAVTGVYSNTGVTVAKAYPVDVSQVSYTDYQDSMSSSLTAIGFDWKTFDQYTFMYHLEDSLIYFVKAKDNSIYSLLFTEFNDTTGEVGFTTEKLMTAIEPVKGAIAQAGIYPNPASTVAMIAVDASQSATAVVDLVDALGRRVMQESFAVHAGLNNLNLSVSQLTPGYYQLLLTAGAQRVTLPLMVTGR